MLFKKEILGFYLWDLITHTHLMRILTLVNYYNVIRICIVALTFRYGYYNPNMQMHVFHLFILEFPHTVTVHMHMMHHALGISYMAKPLVKSLMNNAHSNKFRNFYFAAF